MPRSNGLKLDVLCSLIVSLTMLDGVVACELKHDAHADIERERFQALLDK